MQHVCVCVFMLGAGLFALTFALSSGAIISFGKMCAVCISFTTTKTTTKMERKKKQPAKFKYNWVSKWAHFVCMFYMDAAFHTIHTRLSVKLTFDYFTVHKTKSETHMNVVAFFFFGFVSLQTTKRNLFANYTIQVHIKRVLSL